MVVDTSDPTPPYEQIRRQIVRLIERHKLPGGAKLPPVRQLARDLGLAPGTVARTYKELEAEGYVTTKRGGGTRIARTGVAPERDQPTDAALAEQARLFVEGCAVRSHSLDDVIAAVTEAWCEVGWQSLP
ncbi:GntR family transcriptional regulator [Hoyosella rhizosphaerae]|nr:GntR family transcriptional regulator [Hoyosella rhizosphaerae]